MCSMSMKTQRERERGRARERERGSERERASESEGGRAREGGRREGGRKGERERAREKERQTHRAGEREREFACVCVRVCIQIHICVCAVFALGLVSSCLPLLSCHVSISWVLVSPANLPLIAFLPIGRAYQNTLQRSCRSGNRKQEHHIMTIISVPFVYTYCWSESRAGHKHNSTRKDPDIANLRKGSATTITLRTLCTST